MCRRWDKIERLGYDLSIDDFSCGEHDIDIWFHGYALEEQENGNCSVHVAVDSRGAIVGFFSLSMYYLQRRVLPSEARGGMPDRMVSNVPTVLLGKMGVDARFKGSAWREAGNDPQGPLLLKEAVKIAKRTAHDVGCRLMYVQALNDDLIEWYRAQGFTSMPTKPKNLVLDLRKA